MVTALILMLLPAPLCSQCLLPECVLIILPEFLEGVPARLAVRDGVGVHPAPARVLEIQQ